MLRATPYVPQKPLIGNHFEMSEPLQRRDSLWTSQSKRNEKVIVYRLRLIFVLWTGNWVGNVKHLFPWLCPTYTHNDQEYTEPNTPGVLRPFGAIVLHLASY